MHDFRTGPLPDYLRAAITTMPLIAHGAAFELAVLELNGIKTSKNVFCKLTAPRLLTAGLRDSNDLGAVVKRHLGIDLPKQLGASDWGGMILTDQQLAYCRGDVVHLHPLQEALQEKLANPANEHGDGVKGVDLVRVSQLEMALIPLVADIRARGIKIDRPRLEQILSPTRPTRSSWRPSCGENSDHRSSTLPLQNSSLLLSRQWVWKSGTPTRKPFPPS